MRTVLAAAAMSTCQKPITVCVLLDRDDNVLACESNRCAPSGGRCSRLEMSNTKSDYPLESCNWHHAEVRAIAALAPGVQPYRAMLFGHDFYCDACESQLRTAGVEVLECGGSVIYGTGLTNNQR